MFQIFGNPDNSASGAGEGKEPGKWTCAVAKTAKWPLIFMIAQVLFAVLPTSCQGHKSYIPYLSGPQFLNSLFII